MNFLCYTDYQNMTRPVLFIVSAIALVIVRKLRGDDDGGAPGVPDPDAGPEAEYLHLEVGEGREVGPEDKERTVINYGSDNSEARGETSVVSSYNDPGVTSYSEAGQPPLWGHHGPGPGPRDTYSALLRSQGPSRVKLNPLFHQYS